MSTTQIDPEHALSTYRRGVRHMRAEDDEAALLDRIDDLDTELRFDELTSPLRRDALLAEMDDAFEAYRSARQAHLDEWNAPADDDDRWYLARFEAAHRAGITTPLGMGFAPPKPDAPAEDWPEILEGMISAYLADPHVFDFKPRAFADLSADEQAIALAAADYGPLTEYQAHGGALWNAQASADYLTWIGGGEAEYLPRKVETPPTVPHVWIEAVERDRLTQAPDSRIRLTRASDIKPLRAVWLRDKTIPLGQLTLLAGMGGLGKSTMLYEFAARVTRGQLVGEFWGTPKSVLVAATEDSWEHTIVPRLIAADADLERIIRVEVTAKGGLAFPEDNAALESIAVREDVALLILDPLLSRLGSHDTHKDAEVREALEPLVAVAHRAKFAVVGIIHLNKNESGKSIINRITGSGAFSAIARSVLVVMPDPDDDSLRLLGLAKANLTDATAVPTQVFSVETTTVSLYDPWTGERVEGTTGRVVYSGERGGSLQSAYEHSTQDGEARSVQAQCAEFIARHLREHNNADIAGNVKAAARAINSGWYEKLCQRAANSIAGFESVREGSATIWRIK